MNESEELGYIRQKAATILQQKENICKAEYSRITEQFLIDLAKNTSPEKLKREDKDRGFIDSYCKLIDNLPDAIAIHTNGLLVYANNATAKLLHISDIKQYFGTSIIDFIHPNYRKAILNRFKKIEEIRRVASIVEEEWLRPDGSVIDVEVAYISLDISNKNSIVIALRDISEQKKIERELVVAKLNAEESDRLKSAFLANISHEIRTPMNGIIGFVQLLERDNLSADKRSDYVSIIMKSANRLLNLISDIIDISKIDTGQLELEFKTFNINNIISELYSQCEDKMRELRKTGITLNMHTELLDEQANIFSDQIRLKQILSKLINNALKFTSQGSIEFGYKASEKKFLTFYVRDSGIGIPKEHANLVFDRFRQVDSSHTRKFGGTGLGLTISKGLVELLGGKIGVDSEPDKGTTFFFTHPYTKK